MQFKSSGSFDNGLTQPSQNLLSLLFRAETVFFSHRNECLQSNDAQQILFHKCRVMLSDATADAHSFAEAVNMLTDVISVMVMS